MRQVLLIDGQLFQTGTWHRGMGKYSLETLKALSDKGFFSSFDTVEIILNEKLGLEKERKILLRELYSDFKLSYHELKNRHDIDNVARCEQHNKTVLDTYIQAQYTDATVHFFIPSLFEGDLAVPVYPDVNGIKSLIYYDAIPYLYSKQYLSEERPYSNYFERFGTLFATDIFYTISQTTHNDLITYFGIQPERVCNIDGAPIQMQRNQVTPKKPKVAANYEYVLLPSGNDIRKNNERAAEAFAVFNHNNNRRYKLLITSIFTDEAKGMLHEYCEDIIFTDNVSEAEMKWLYNNAKVVFFPPLYEGLGLPILEAIESNKPIACSAIPVFQEMSTKAFCYFDPYSVESMVIALDQAIEHTPVKAEYAKVAKKYAWSRTAEVFVEKWEKHQTNSKTQHEPLPKIAVFGPDPHGLSGIGKMMQLLHPALTEKAEVDYYLEDNISGMHKTAYLQHVANTYPVESFSIDTYSQYDAVVYHIGNSDYHNQTYLVATRFPGFAIFHDSKLDGLMNTLKAADLITEKRLELETVINKSAKNNKASFVATLANNQLGVITHSNYTLNAIKSHTSIPEEKVFAKLNLPVSNPVDMYHRTDKNLTIGVAGILHATKGLAIVEQLAASDDFSQCNFKLFGYGFGASESELAGLLALSNVEIITDVSDLEFNTLLGSVDILLNYRPTYNGESSYVTVEGMRNGATVVVRDIGWFSELPDDSVVKLKDDFTIDENMKELIKDEKRRVEISQKAREVIAAEYSFEKYAQNLLQVIAKTKQEVNSLPAEIRKVLLETSNNTVASRKIRKLIMERSQG